MKTPRFKQHIHPTIIDTDKLILSSEFGHQLLTSKSLIEVVKHLDGKLEVSQIIEKLDGVVDKSQVYYILSSLETKKYISEAENVLSNSESSFWSSFSEEESAVALKKSNAKIKIYSFGDYTTEVFSKELNHMDFNVVEENENFAVLITNDYLQNELALKARALWKKDIPFIICKPNGIQAWIGPIFKKDDTACFDCLLQRLVANRDVDVYLKENGYISSPIISNSSTNATIKMVYQLTIMEISKFLLVTDKQKIKNDLITFDFSTTETIHHTIVKRPQCKTCGEEKYLHNDRLPEKIKIQSRIKKFTDGGHRSITATETYNNYKHLISPISGIVNKLERITSSNDELQHVYISGQNMALKTANFFSLKKNLRSNSCGKGSTEIQAKVSAIGEAIERYSGVFRNEEPRIKSTYNKLEGKAIHPNSCMLFSESQYKNRDAINAEGSFFNVIPNKLDEDAEIDWSPVWSLTRKDYVYIPTAYCYYSHPENAKSDFYNAPDSNGCAAGNTIEEAILQGFLELIERDSVCLWWYNRLNMPKLDIESFNDTYANNLVAYHTSRNRDLWVLDLTADTGIPAFIAISARNDRTEFQDIVFAPAAHLNPEIALRRALTELNQMMPSMDDSLPLGEYNYDDPETVHWWRTCNLINQPYLLPNTTKPATKLSDFKLPIFNDLKDDLIYCKSKIEALGLELHVLDQTRPDIGLNVVKVFVPGLRHFWKRNKEGRLYDVPVKMGWLEKPLEEKDLNPISMFI
ncbi:TOMM precursor leader peptide-binding protein [Tenacibaculum amylolyticum]|uniref:TOMM precursor leader peptide-binding protein n=1 Tax=Tenacibaculum amylolyticum TaxID=104269 RepID=UPI003894DB5E